MPCGRVPIFPDVRVEFSSVDCSSDIPCMDLLEEIAQEDRSGMIRVLSEYRSRQKKLRADNPEYDGWVPRIIEMEDVESDGLCRIHGQLIAWGCLKFQIANRCSGVVYQISSEGNALLESRSENSLNSDSHDAAA